MPRLRRVGGKEGGRHGGGKSTSSVTHWNSPPGQHWAIMTVAVGLSMKNMWHSEQTSWLTWREVKKTKQRKTLSSHQCNGLLASMYEIWRPLCVCEWAWHVCECTGGSVCTRAEIRAPACMTINTQSRCVCLSFQRVDCLSGLRPLSPQAWPTSSYTEVLILYECAQPVVATVDPLMRSPTLTQQEGNGQPVQFLPQRQIWRVVYLDETWAGFSADGALLQNSPEQVFLIDHSDVKEHLAAFHAERTAAFMHQADI